VFVDWGCIDVSPKIGFSRLGGFCLSWHTPLAGTSPLRRNRLYGLRFPLVGVLSVAGVCSVTGEKGSASTGSLIVDAD
jgi:hypothetical protein